MNDVLKRTTFTTSRRLDFFSAKELTAQIGHAPLEWPLVVLKELIDNALDACEEAGMTPVIDIAVDNTGISVSDNGPGLPLETLTGLLDYSVRVSSREAYVAPDRGAQGNALKTVVAMPLVLDGERGQVDISVGDERHEIVCQVDRIRQEPVITRSCVAVAANAGTAITVWWPDSAGSILRDAQAQILQTAEGFAFMNPHLTLTVDCWGTRYRWAATDTQWEKWTPSQPTSPHWYKPEHLGRLIAATIAHGQDPLVREFLQTFKGLTGSASQKRVLDATGLARQPLSYLRDGVDLDHEKVRALLTAMQAHTKPVKPRALGVIGEAHLRTRFEAVGCDLDTFQYRKVLSMKENIPQVTESAFGYCPDPDRLRTLITGINWSTGLITPFRKLGKTQKSLDTILQQQNAEADEEIAVLLHVAHPRVEFADRGKSSVIVED